MNRALLVQLDSTQPQPDLAHTLARWQEAGIALQLRLLTTLGPAVPLRVARPSLFKAFWYRLVTSLRYRRSPLGGFGGTIPDPHSGFSSG